MVAMTINEKDECKKIEEAFMKAMKVFDESAVRVLVSQLEEKYNIRLGSVPCSSLAEIEAALLCIAGVGSDLETLTSRIRSFLR
jgi:hypothetical protein